VICTDIGGGWLQAAKSKGEKSKTAAVPQLQLLHNITGSFRPGVLTALMGVSGMADDFKVSHGDHGST
jgi:hypothetical protein